MAVKPPAPQPPPSIFGQFRSVRFWVTLGIVLLANILISNFLFQPAQPKTVTIAYSTFKQQVSDNNIYRWAGMLLSEAGKLVEARAWQARVSEKEVADEVAQVVEASRGGLL